MQNKKLTIVIAVLFIAVGLGVMIFPKITDMAYRHTVISEEKEFTEQDPDVERLYKELCRRNKELYENKQSELSEPFSYEQPSISLKEYGIKDNTIGFIKIPKMDVKLPILLGANEENMAKGAVHLTQTSYPVGGKNTNCVIAAHRGYAYTAMFKDIEKLTEGDKIYILNFREKLVYKVAKIEIIDPSDINKLLIQEGKDMVSLITCHPYRYNYQRYVVYCERYK